jgi:hypothetical protein
MDQNRSVYGLGSSSLPIVYRVNVDQFHCDVRTVMHRCKNLACVCVAGGAELRAQYGLASVSGNACSDVDEAPLKANAMCASSCEVDRRQETDCESGGNGRDAGCR